MSRLADEAAYFGALQDGVDSQQERISKLEQQLAEREKQIVMLRDAIEEGLITYRVPRTARIMEALAASDDLSDCILCDAEPIAWLWQDTIINMPFQIEGEVPLYKARTK